MRKFIQLTVPKPQEDASQAQRKDLDFYVTPPELALAICQYLAELFTPTTILEPHAGLGAFVASARTVWPLARVASGDIVQRESPMLSLSHLHVVQDWLSPTYVLPCKPDLVVGNPPYLNGEQHVGLGIERTTQHVAFLLRNSFLGSAGRLESLTRSGPRGQGLYFQIPITPRPDFADGKTDNSEYSVFVWKKGYRRLAQIGDPIEWVPDKLRRKAAKVADALAAGKEG